MTDVDCSGSTTTPSIATSTGADLGGTPLGGTLGRLRSHGLHAPTPADVRRALWIGSPDHPDETWARACELAAVPADAHALPLDDLARVTDALVGMGGAIGLVGRAMAVRIGAYRAISARGGDAPAPPWDWARAAMDTLLRDRGVTPERIRALLALDPFAPEVRVELDQAATRAAQRLGTVMGGVSVVLGGAQCLVGSHGARGSWVAEAGGNPIEWAFCATSVRTGEPYVVPDARNDVLHRYNPTCVQDRVGSYAGAPLITSSGVVLGNCCVVDAVPRDFTDDDVAVLVEEAGAIVAELERRREQRTTERLAG